MHNDYDSFITAPLGQIQPFYYSKQQFLVLQLFSCSAHLSAYGRTKRINIAYICTKGTKNLNTES